MKRIAVVGVAVLLHASVFGQGVAYVDADAPPPGDGSSWATAFVDLQGALAAAASSGGAITELWIAEGVYLPEAPGGPRTTSFDLVEGVMLYGGFDGTETQLSQRNWTTHRSVLDGDLLGNDVPGADYWDASRADNTYQVVTATATTIVTGLDGIVVSGGHASGSTETDGGGVSVNTGALTLRNCTFERNIAANAGGAVWVLGTAGSMTLEDCVFQDNDALSSGGAVAAHWTNLACVNCQFLDNGAETNEGGALKVFGFTGSMLSLTSCVFSGNQGSMRGGAVYPAVELLEIEDCAFTGNGHASMGGAVYNAGQCYQVTVTGCSFSYNTGASGGAWYTDRYTSLDPTSFIDCVFEGNSVAGYGGALRAFNAVGLEGCSFIGNTAERGGAIHTDSPLVVRNGLFEGNHATSMGGALRQKSASSMVVRTDFIGNSAMYGGAVSLGSTTKLRYLASCRFLGNTATERGGAIRVNSSSQATLVNSLLSGNSAGEGGAVYVDPGTGTTAATLEGCTVTANHATLSTTGGIFLGLVYPGFVDLRNSIVWGNTAAAGPATAQLGGNTADFTVDWCGVQDWTGALAGERTFGFDPEFVDPLGPDLVAGTIDDDCRLQPTSPYRDAGSNAWVGQDLGDLDGDGDDTELVPLDLDLAARFHDDAYRCDTGEGVAPIVDLGAYETPGVSPGCSTSRFCLAGINSLGVGAQLHTLGSLSLTQGDLTLLAGPCEPLQFGLFFYGAAQIQLPFGDGYRCVGAGGVGLFRFNPALKCDAAGWFTRPIDFDAPPADSGPGEILAGSTWSFQLWYRDPLGPGGNQFNASDGMSVTFCP